MRVAFSSTFVRLSGAFCVVLTGLSPLPAQIASPSAVATAPADTHSDPSFPATRRPGGQTSGELPYIDFFAPGIIASETLLPLQPAVQAKTDSKTAAKRNLTNDVTVPHGDSRTPQTLLPPVSENTDVVRSVYQFLDYVPMTCSDAFGEPDGVVQHPLFAASFKAQIDNEQPSEGSAEKAESRHQEVSALKSPHDETPARTSRRSLSEIRLGESLTQLSDSGEPLPTPESFQDGSKVQVPAEHHFVPAPWVRSHASRNTYPIRYQPLYFEDPNMERCGDSCGLFTEATSIAHFAARIPLLPYMMASNSPHECVNALPDCPTCSQFGPDAYLPRPTVKAIAAQAAATVAGAYIIP